MTDSKETFVSRCFKSGDSEVWSDWRSGACGLPEKQLLAQALPQLRGLTVEDRLLVCGDIRHWRTAALITQAIARGVRVWVLAEFCPATALEVLRVEQITCSDWLPWQLSAVFQLAATASRPSKPPASGGEQAGAHRRAWVGGARTPLRVKLAALECWGPILHEHFSGLNWPGYCEIDAPAGLAHAHSVGRWHGARESAGEPEADSKLVVLDAASNVRAADQIGQFGIVANDTEPLLTGDVGYLSTEGLTYVLGRSDNCLSLTYGREETGQVAPGETQGWLETHPGVQEAVLLAINEDVATDMGLAACFYAVVQLNESAGAATPLLEVELLQFCQQGLSDIKCPAGVLFVAQLPRQLDGKPDLAALGALVAKSLVVQPP